MRRFLLITALSVFIGGAYAQSLTVTSPALEPPYEVAAGTQVTFTLTSNTEPAAFYSTTQTPVFPEFGVDPSWTVHENFVDNGNGTYSLTLTLNQPIYIWGAHFSDWIGWSFSNVIDVSILSGVTVTAVDGKLCDETDTETLSVTGTYASYQWYFNNEPIDGATTNTLAADKEGYYKVQVPKDSKQVFSNTIRVRVASINMIGSLPGNGKIDLTASAQLTSYQWLSGSTENNLTPIGGATNNTYSATLTGTTTYYALKGTIAGCTVQSAARPASTTLFTIPVITVDAPENQFGKTCLGTEVKMSVPDVYATYVWYYNDAEFISSEPTTLTLHNETGDFYVKVNPLHWPEMTLTSANASVDYFEILEPQLSGVTNHGSYCHDEELSITLNDEGYTYKWYVHEDFEYTEEDDIEVNSPTYSFTFENKTYITVVASFLGCESSTRLFLDSYESAVIYLDVSDFDQLFLCPGSTVDLSVPEPESYSSFQWFKKNGASFQAINGKTTSLLTVNAVGIYRVEAKPVGCSSVTVTSFEKEIKDYSKRELFIYADQEAICDGEETTLHIDSEWTNIQWFRKKIMISNSGYIDTYVPLEGSGTTADQVVDKYNTYVVKAKHQSCAAGLKTTSAPIQIKPTLNPDLLPDPEQEPLKYHRSPFDSIPSYIFCEGAPAGMKVSDEFDSYEWYSASYTGDGDYTPGIGTKIDNETTQYLDITAYGARWYTVKVRSGDCVGYSDGLLIDTWVHNNPAVGSVSNGELCDENDSTVLSLAFPGNWVKFAWYRDGELVPNSDNDSLYAKEPGGYTISGFPSECPNIEYNSGLPAPVTMFPGAWIEENDTVIYAMPEFGFYEFQWYKDGEPYEADRIPWVLWKSELEPGTYTVQVTNPKGCTGISEGYVWTITGVEEDLLDLIALSPNPTNGTFAITGVEEATIKEVNVYSIQGQRIRKSVIATVDMTATIAGVYLVEVVTKDQKKKMLRLVKK